MMAIKAKYTTPFGVCFKYFHTTEEMNNFFQEYKMCKFISLQEGQEVAQEAEKYGYR